MLCVASCPWRREFLQYQCFLKRQCINVVTDKFKRYHKQICLTHRLDFNKSGLGSNGNEVGNRHFPDLQNRSLAIGLNTERCICDFITKMTAFIKQYTDIELWSVMIFLHCNGKNPNDIHRELDAVLGEHLTSRKKQYQFGVVRSAGGVRICTASLEQNVHVYSITENKHDLLSSHDGSSAKSVHFRDARSFLNSRYLKLSEAKLWKTL